jgi:Fe-S-cluster containining protein
MKRKAKPEPKAEQPLEKEKLHSIHITKNTPKEYIEVLGKQCTQCGHCCKFGSGYVLEDDIKRISRYLGIPEQAFIDSSLDQVEHFGKKLHKMKLDKKGKAFGSCIFFRPGNACIIHDVKPFHCRISMGCGEHGQQISLWFMLNYLVDPKNPESVRQYATYLKTHPTIPGGQLHELVPDKETLIRIIEYKILK